MSRTCSKPALPTWATTFAPPQRKDCYLKPDHIIAQAAKSEDRILVTFDVGFGNIRLYPPGSHPGILLFRPARYGPSATLDFIERFFRQAKWADLLGCVTVIEPNRMRVRRPTP